MTSAGAGCGAGAGSGTAIPADDAGELTLQQFVELSGGEWPGSAAEGSHKESDSRPIEALRFIDIEARLKGHAVRRACTRSWRFCSLYDQQATRRHCASITVPELDPDEVPTSFQHPILRTLALGVSPPSPDAAAHMETAPSSQLLKAVAAFGAAVQQPHVSETARADLVMMHLAKLFSACGSEFGFTVHRQGGVMSLGLVAGSAAGKAVGGSPRAGVQVAALIGVTDGASSCSSLWRQLFELYRRHVRYAKSAGNSQLLLLVSRMPIIFATVNGTALSYGAGIIDTVPTYQRYHGPIRLECSGDAAKSAHVAAHVRALVAAVDATRHYLARHGVVPDGTADAPSARGASLCFPHLELTPEGTSSPHRVKFLQHVQRGVFRVMWSGSAAVLKVCQVNNDAAQEVLARDPWHGAPRIMHRETLTGAQGVVWRVIVMEDLFVQGFRMLHERSAAETAWIRAAVTSRLEQLLAVLHNNDKEYGDHAFVFFDVRPPNVMVRVRGEVKAGGASTGATTMGTHGDTGVEASREPAALGSVDVKLVDFGMCASVGDPRPPDLNEYILWPDAKRTELSAQDDVDMLSLLYGRAEMPRSGWCV